MVSIMAAPSVSVEMAGKEPLPVAGPIYMVTLMGKFCYRLWQNIFEPYHGLEKSMLNWLTGQVIMLLILFILLKLCIEHREVC